MAYMQREIDTIMDTKNNDIIKLFYTRCVSHGVVKWKWNKFCKFKYLSSFVTPAYEAFTMLILLKIMLQRGWVSLDLEQTGIQTICSKHYIHKPVLGGSGRRQESKDFLNCRSYAGNVDFMRHIKKDTNQLKMIVYRREWWCWICSGQQQW